MLQTDEIRSNIIDFGEKDTFNHFISPLLNPRYAEESLKYASETIYDDIDHMK